MRSPGPRSQAWPPHAGRCSRRPAVSHRCTSADACTALSDADLPLAGRLSCFQGLAQSHLLQEVFPDTPSNSLVDIGAALCPLTALQADLGHLSYPVTVRSLMPGTGFCLLSSNTVPGIKWVLTSTLRGGEERGRGPSWSHADGWMEVGCGSGLHTQAQHRRWAGSGRARGSGVWYPMGPEFSPSGCDPEQATPLSEHRRSGW